MLADAPVPLDDANHVRYGVSSTPTVVLVDRAGLIRLYHPGQMTRGDARAAHPRVARAASRARTSVKSLLGRLVLVLFGGLTLALATFIWVQGGPERGRLARLKAEGQQVRGTIAAIDLERRPATTASGETIRGKYETYRMARVRYTVGGVTFTPDQRFALAGDQADSRRRAAPSPVIVLPDMPDKPFSPSDSIATTRVVVVLLPLMLAAAGVLSLWRAGSRRH